MKKNKKKRGDQIKSLNLDAASNNGKARAIVISIANVLGLKLHEDKQGVSAYGGNAIRLSDHCTYLQTWVDNGTWNAPYRYDIVIEDAPTQAITQVRKGFDFSITEFVINSSELEMEQVKSIAYDIKNVLNGNQFANNVGMETRKLVSTHKINEKEQYNRNMKKNRIRLTESQLHCLIKESVKKVLNEGNKGGYPLGAHIDANDEAVGLMYQDYFGKNYDRDKNRKDVDIINNRTFDELNDDEEITQEIQNFIQSIANKHGISQKRATDMFKGYFNRYHNFFKDERQAGY